jgi:hypothetical protein
MKLPFIFGRLARRAATVGTAAIALVATSCVDKQKCDEAIQVTRDSLAKDQPDIARQWRDRAWKICNDPSMTTPLDKEITDKEAEIQKRAADQTKAIADAAQQRMNTSTAVWKGFDKLDPKAKTEAALDAYRDKAQKMSDGLPTDYAKQLDDYNARAYEQRKRMVEAAAAK